MDIAVPSSDWLLPLASAQYFGGNKVQYPFDRPEKGWLFEFNIKPGF